MKSNFTKLCIYALLCVFVSAETTQTRKWRDATGSKSFIGSYVGFENGKVIITSGNKEYKMPLDKLHENDQEWIRNRKNADVDKDLANRGVFDTLRFGDSYRTVLEKLKESQIVVSNVGNGIFAGLTGLNGKFRTKNKIGDLQCFLYFDWKTATQSGAENTKNLTGLELRSDPVTTIDVPGKLKNSWSELIGLFEMLYGPASYEASRYPSLNEINQMGGIVGTHRWKIPTAEIVLGPAIDPKNKSYFLYVVINHKP